MTACITGWSHSKFGKLENETLESMIIKVSSEALQHAGLAAKDIDEIYLGHFNAGFSKQDFTASLVLQASDDFRFKPAVRVENACATGTAAVHQAVKSIKAGKANHILVVGAEQMTTSDSKSVAQNLLKAAYLAQESDIPAGFAGVFGQIADSYFQRHGDQSDALATLAVKNHKNGSHNPYAHMQKELSYDFCREASEKNPIVAGPLKRTDCSMVSDGAAAIILSDINTSLSMPRAITFRATAHAQDFLPMSKRDMVKFEGCQSAWQKAFAEANVAIDDLSLIETHDCFTIAELIEYEAMGLANPGEGGKIALEGQTEIGGKLPVNPSGGLKAKGHPIGATGVSMHVMCAMQLTESSPSPIQIKSPKLAGIFNMGGAAVANYVSILERIR